MYVAKKNLKNSSYTFIYISYFTIPVVYTFAKAFIQKYFRSRRLSLI